MLEQSADPLFHESHKPAQLNSERSEFHRSMKPGTDDPSARAAGDLRPAHAKLHSEFKRVSSCAFNVGSTWLNDPFPAKFQRPLEHRFIH
jgi:hypothetical protein